MDDFDFYQNQDNGQLWLADRRWIWNTVRELQPALAAETGTWMGGGSTFFIASAMHANGTGLLHSVESNVTMYGHAVRSYRERWPHLRPHVTLHLGDSVDVYCRVLAGATLDFVFLDGSDEAMLPEFNLLSPMVRRGGVLMCHDWHNGKAEQLKPVLGFAPGHGGRLFEHPDWNIEIIGEGGGDFEHGSVGLMKATRR